MKTQGYVVLACDQDKYRDMAINIARSLKFFDPKRSICLLHNDKIAITPECENLFDNIRLIEDRRNYVGVMNKARLYDYSPFEQSMYVDADMLLMRPNINAYWEALDGHYFNMTGSKETSGQWYNMDIGTVISKFDVPYIVRMNSGVFYFEKGEPARKFFERAINIFDTYKDVISKIHQGRSGQYADEPIFGLAMGEAGIQPMQNIIGHGSWMVTTWQSRKYAFDPENGVSYLQRSTGYPYRQAWLSRGWVHHSPNFVHFIGLKPRPVYDRLSTWFRDRLAK